MTMSKRSGARCRISSTTRAPAMPLPTTTSLRLLAFMMRRSPQLLLVEKAIPHSRPLRSESLRPGDIAHQPAGCHKAHARQQRGRRDDPLTAAEIGFPGDGQQQELDKYDTHQARHDGID